LNEKPNQHIGPEELAKLLERARCGAGSQAENGHLSVCSTCREQFEELAALDRQFKHLRPVQSVQQSGDCPQATVWCEIAAGLPQSEETLACIEHATDCDRCAPLLREAVLEFSGLNRELTEDEQKQIASLESAGTQWQQKLARRITGTPLSQPNRKSAPWWQSRLSLPPQVLAAASLLIVAGVGSWIVSRQIRLRRQPAAAESLLARAYTKKRTIEPRIAGAYFAPMKVTRGEAGSFTDRPKELLNAEALIDDQLESEPTNPAWLQAKAEADMLEGKYEPAVEGLRRAVELEPHSAALLTDLATAYFQRGLSQDKKDDLGAAYENLSKALAFKPGDPIALFNRAIVSEHLFLYHQALDDWNHYLSVDPGSQWSQEARSHLDAVQQKLKEHSNAKPLLSPEQLLAAASGASPPSEVDQRIEEYLDEAVRSWLPAAFPEVTGNEVAKNTDGVNGTKLTETKLDPDPNALQALFFLAGLTSQHHGDNWLSDLLRSSSTPHFPQAAAALARAVKANSVGEYDVARQQADLAEQLFRVSVNTAGVLRAQFEQALAAQLTRRSEECGRKAASALAASRKYSYSWLQIQLGLEKSVCSSLMGDIGTGRKAEESAMDRAQGNGYGVLYLRALGFAADDEIIDGDPSTGLRLASAGLQIYWAGQFPPRRGYNLYTELAFNAQAAGRPNLQTAVFSEAVALIDSDENPKQWRALAHNEMADAATAAHLPQIAEREYAEVARLLATVPRTEDGRSKSLETEVRTAQLESQQGQSDDAIERLTRIQDRIRSLSNNYVAEMFYSTLGELQLGRHREAEAEQALRPALALAEQSLATLKSQAERASWSQDSALTYLALVEAELAQGRAQEALDTYEWYLAAPWRMTADPRPRRTLTDPPLPEPSKLAYWRPLLTKETVLTYAVLPDGLAIWAYDDHDFKASWNPKSTKELQELAGRFHDLSSDPGSELSALQRDSRSLYELLIFPVEQHLAPGRALVIEADGWLASIPFEALLDANGHYLIERGPIVHSLGQDSQLRLSTKTGISRDLPALVVGSSASSSAEGLIPIPDVVAEADAVAGGFHSARVLKGREATLSAVIAELPGAAIFHFAGHSLSTPGRTGLMLAGKTDGGEDAVHLMDADTVRQLGLENLRLAVLSACSTANGSGGTNGFDSVTAAFLRAGVPHVVASRWPVDSDATRGFVKDFYRNALVGQTISDAIRLASLRMLANRDTSHPYYWAAFVAYGRL
jgi:CHAT domain-containing protein